MTHFFRSQVLLVSIANGLTWPAISHGDTFGTGENQFEIEFVTIGDPGNPDDPVGWPRGQEYATGAVEYSYRIAKYEIAHHMVAKAIAESADDSVPLDFELGEFEDDKPAFVSWSNSAKFVNWLNTSQGFSPAYKFVNGMFAVWEPGDAGSDPENTFRNRRARYALSSVNEWHKAAYYDPSTESYFLYPTGSNDPPVAVASGIEPNTAVYGMFPTLGLAGVPQAGGLSPYGTMAQGGNLRDWQEDAYFLDGDPIGPRILRGGRATSPHEVLRASAASRATGHGGAIRVVIVPEPHPTYLLAPILLPFVWKRLSL